MSNVPDIEPSEEEDLGFFSNSDVMRELLDYIENESEQKDEKAEAIDAYDRAMKGI